MAASRPLQRRSCASNLIDKNSSEPVNDSKQQKIKESKNKPISDTHQSNYQLTYEQRKDRLLLVFTLTAGFLIVVLKVFFKYLQNVYNSIYIYQDTLWGQNFPLGPEHIAFPIIVSSLIVILFYVIIYCYMELCTFGTNLNLEKKCKESADKAFNNLLDVIKANIQLCTLAFTSIFIVLNISSKTPKVVLTIWILYLVIFIVLIVILIWKFSSKPKDKVKLMISNLGIYFFVTLLIFVFSFLNLGKKYNISVKFDDQNFSSQIVYNCIFFPDNFDVEIKNLDNKSETNIPLNSNDFQKKHVAVTLNEEDSSINKKTKKVLLDKSVYTYVKTINLKEYLTEGRYSFEVKFVISNKSVSLYNEIIVANGKISFTEKELSLQD